MSNLEKSPVEAVCGGVAPTVGEPQVLTGREVVLGGPRGMAVTRTVPHRDRRMVGAWCFVDHYGPHDIAGAPGMRVPPHPHIGLQTVSWLVRGEVLHRDSLGNRQLIEPGQLNLMTAGRAIAHSEESPEDHSGVLHGVQLWVALPEAHRAVAPHFEHHADLPVARVGPVRSTVFAGEFCGVAAPARTYSPLLGAQVEIPAGARVVLPVREEFEHAVLVLRGRAEVAGTGVGVGPLLYLGTGRDTVPLAAAEPTLLLLLGGEPFTERIVMWWNFVARDHQEIVAAREDWTARRGYGRVRGYAGEALAAPALPGTPLKPRGRVR